MSYRTCWNWKFFAYSCTHFCHLPKISSLVMECSFPIYRNFPFLTLIKCNIIHFKNLQKMSQTLKTLQYMTKKYLLVHHAMTLTFLCQKQINGLVSIWVGPPSWKSKWNMYCWNLGIWWRPVDVSNTITGCVSESLTLS